MFQIPNATDMPIVLWVKCNGDYNGRYNGMQITGTVVTMATTGTQNSKGSAHKATGTKTLTTTLTMNDDNGERTLLPGWQQLVTQLDNL